MTDENRLWQIFFLTCPSKWKNLVQPLLGACSEYWKNKWLLCSWNVLFPQFQHLMCFLSSTLIEMWDLKEVVFSSSSLLKRAVQSLFFFCGRTESLFLCKGPLGNEAIKQIHWLVVIISAWKAHQHQIRRVHYQRGTELYYRRRDRTGMNLSCRLNWLKTSRLCDDWQDRAARLCLIALWRRLLKHLQQLIV